jgi:hypothetical protein
MRARPCVADRTALMITVTGDGVPCIYSLTRPARSRLYAQPVAETNAVPALVCATRLDHCLFDNAVRVHMPLHARPIVRR